MKPKNINKIKTIFLKYRHGLFFLYFFLYLYWFTALEQSVTTKYHPVHTWLDDYIPFNEYFIIPYVLWFIYIAGVILYFFFNSKEDFYKCCAFLFIGMTICLIIYTIWPNGQNLRPTTFARDNIFVDIIKAIYATDTNTNVFPSIHVFNSIGAYIAISSSKRLKKHTFLLQASFILTILISLSTVFLKQHSILDGLAAFILAIVMYLIVYVPDYSRFYVDTDEKEKEYQLENP